MASKIIEVNKINVFYGENHVLKDVTISFSDSEVTAIMGPSGCGKSTLIRCLKPDARNQSGSANRGRYSVAGRIDLFGQSFDPAPKNRNGVSKTQSVSNDEYLR